MRAAKPPYVVGKLGVDGEWRVLLMVPTLDGAASFERELTPDEADSIARQLLEHSALVRDKLGLPGGAPYPSGA